MDNNQEPTNSTQPYPPTDNHYTTSIDYSAIDQFSSKNNATNYITTTPSSPSLLNKSTTTVLEQGNYRIHVIGTAHVSTESAREVRELILEKKPAIVILELCSGRSSILISPADCYTSNITTTNTFKNRKPFEKSENSFDGENSSPMMVMMDKTISDEKDKNCKQQSLFSLLMDYVTKKRKITLLQLALVYFMQKVTRDLKVQSGIEMKAAYDISVKLNSRVILGDRPIDITLNRCWHSMSYYQKFKFISHILYACTQTFSSKDIEMLKQSDILTDIIEEFADQFPQLSKVLVDERDAYLTHSILKAIEHLENERLRKEQMDSADEVESNASNISSNNSTALESKLSTTNTTDNISNVTNESKENQAEEDYVNNWNRSEDEEMDTSETTQPELDPNSIVVVVGAGHVNGITKYFSNPEKINRREIMKRYKNESNAGTIFLTVFILSILLAIILYLFKDLFL